MSSDVSKATWNADVGNILCRVSPGPRANHDYIALGYAAADPFMAASSESRRAGRNASSSLVDRSGLDDGAVLRIAKENCEASSQL